MATEAFCFCATACTASCSLWKRCAAKVPPSQRMPLTKAEKGSQSLRGPTVSSRPAPSARPKLSTSSPSSEPKSAAAKWAAAQGSGRSLKETLTPLRAQMATSAVRVRKSSSSSCGCAAQSSCMRA